MAFPIKCDTGKSKWSFVNIEGQLVKISKSNKLVAFLILKIDLVLTDSAELDVMPPNC